MYLKSIEIQGFKSFANKLLFEFHNGITGIVGPNGSGKSNVADAVRWVLGEQRIKQLRGASMQDVIFSGTELRKPQGFAYVAITLDNSDHQLAIDYDQVTVSRRLYRSGESEYMINGSTCRLKDINELFYDTGMRMDQRQSRTAADIVNGYDEKELYRIIRDYGEDKFAKNIAKHIVAARAKAPIQTTGELTEIIRQSIPMKIQATGGHPAKRTFQAIRIELNRELDVLRESLDGMIDLLDDGGRICIITFHSLEDRIVKTIFRKNENPCTCPPDFPVCVCGKESKGKVITRKPILPSKVEMEENPRSKSAKLRIFERRYKK